MPKRLKRYEILLPLKYNDGTEVEQGKFHETRGELIDRFGAVTIEPVPSKGFWLWGCSLQQIGIHIGTLYIRAADTCGDR